MEGGKEEEDVDERDGSDDPDSGVLDVLGLTRKHQHTPAIDVGAVTGAGVMGLLRELFSCLLTEIQGFIQFGEKLDS